MSDELDRELDAVQKNAVPPVVCWVSNAWLDGAVNAFLITEAEANEIRRTAPMVGPLYSIESDKWDDLFDRIRGAN